MTISTYIGISLLMATTTFCVKVLADVAFGRRRSEPLAPESRQWLSSDPQSEHSSVRALKHDVRNLECACHANEYALRKVVERKPANEEEFQAILTEAYTYTRHLKGL